MINNRSATCPVMQVELIGSNYTVKPAEIVDGVLYRQEDSSYVYNF